MIPQVSSFGGWFHHCYVLTTIIRYYFISLSIVKCYFVVQFSDKSAIILTLYL